MGLRRPSALLAGLLLLAAAAPAELIDSLHGAGNEAEAARCEAALLDAWEEQATPAVQLLVRRASLDAARRNLPEARADLDAAVALEPDLSDLWRRRGEVRMLAGDTSGAAADETAALGREPRNVAALADLTAALEARGQLRAARENLRKLLAISPHHPGGAAALERLNRKIYGQPT